MEKIIRTYILYMCVCVKAKLSSMNNHRQAMMKKVCSSAIPVLLFCVLCCTLSVHNVQAQPSTIGYNCTATNQSTNSCKTYVLYRAAAPKFTNLASIGDLFSVSRRMIAEPSNIPDPAAPLLSGELLFVPIRCSCNVVNNSITISYAALNYTIQIGDTFYRTSTKYYQNLTTYQSVEVVNPTFEPTKLKPGNVIMFPIFCRCPNSSQLQNRVNYLISYVFQPFDNLTSIASRFGTTVQSIIDVNGNSVRPLDTLFVPVSKLPKFTQPIVPPATPLVMTIERKRNAIGLEIAVGICALLLILGAGVWVYRDSSMKKKQQESYKDAEKQQMERGGKGPLNAEEVSLMADVSGCLDKYKVFGIDELRTATEGFDDQTIIRGSVYKGSIDGEWYAIKKMKWNAYEELKILQKVNHGNLVRLEGFCIDQEGANCFLVYEYVENGSLSSWLHENKPEKLSWRPRLKIAIDVANGLQYIHEHTRPKVVHKDIKSSNILLDSNMRAKIANFGLAKSGCNAITMHIVGTQGYMAPEYLADGVVSTKMDIFSFGVVLLELISGREAIDEQGNVLWASGRRILEATDGRKTMKLRDWADPCIVSDGQMEGVMNVMAVAVACVNSDPSKRPTMVEIVYALSKSDDMETSEEGFSPRQVDAR